MVQCTTTILKSLNSRDILLTDHMTMPAMIRLMLQSSEDRWYAMTGASEPDSLL